MQCENNINPCSACPPTTTTNYCTGVSPFLEVLAFKITGINWKTNKQTKNNLFCLFSGVITNKQARVRAFLWLL